MPRNLKLDKGKLIDAQSGKDFNGVASRDLEVGDSYEEKHADDTLRVMKVTSKTVTEDGCTVIVMGGF